MIIIIRNLEIISARVMELTLVCVLPDPVYASSGKNMSTVIRGQVKGKLRAN